MSKDRSDVHFEQIHYGLGNEMYVTPCAICGEPVKTWVKRTTVTFKCKRCRANEANKTDSLKQQIRQLTLQRRIQGAKELILKQHGNLEEYERGLELVAKNIDNKFWFESINEVVVTLELIRCKVTAHHQVKVGKYRVDFVLPGIKVLLEIDGKQHSMKGRREKDKLKETVMLASFGPEWEVVRISEDLIKQDVRKLVPAIKAVIVKRRRLRKNHYGQLPKYYSEQF